MGRFKKFLSKERLLAGGAVLVLIVAFFLGRASVDNGFLEKKSQATLPEQRNQELSPEIQMILSLKNLDDQAPHLKALLERVGPAEAQEQLYRSGLPFTGETHFLVHVIGDYVYEQFGVESISHCKDYFLAACYHGALIHIIASDAFEGVVEAIESCARENIHVASQCSHAVGHGFLAWSDYDLLATLANCDRVGDQTKDFVHFNCYDGVFMENLWGVHGGGPSPNRWFSTTDPYYPCNDPRIPEKYLGGCWANQASTMYQMFGGDLKKTAEGCDGVENAQHRETCYNNFARQIHPLTQGQADKAFELCENATGGRWKNYCLTTIVGAAFSVGDQEKMPYEICARISSEAKSQCYDQLFGLIQSYSLDSEARARELCGRVIESEEQARCWTFQTRIF